MARGHLLALLVAIGLPVPARALPIVEFGEGGDGPIATSRTWDGPGIGDLGMDGFELSSDFRTLSLWDRDDLVAGLLGGASAGNVGGADLTAAGTGVWLEAPEADPAF